MPNLHPQVSNAAVIKQAFIEMGVLPQDAKDSDVQDVYHRYMQANHPDVTPNMPHDLSTIPAGKLRTAMDNLVTTDAEVETDPNATVGATTTMFSFDTQTNPAAESAAEAAAIETLHGTQQSAPEFESLVAQSEGRDVEAEVQESREEIAAGGDNVHRTEVQVGNDETETVDDEDPQQSPEGEGENIDLVLNGIEEGEEELEEEEDKEEELEDEDWTKF